MPGRERIPVIDDLGLRDESLTGLVVSDFEGRNVTMRRDGEKLWLSSNECAELLQTSRQSIAKLYKQYSDEFDNNSARVNESLTGDGPPRRQREFSLEGLSLLCMFSRTPVAARVRAWAKKLMAETWTRGKQSQAIEAPAVKEIIAELVTAVVNPILESQERRLKAEMDQRFAKGLVPANQDVTGWPTPTQRLRALGIGCPLPGRFNSGGRFDMFFADEHYKEMGGYPHVRCRRYIGKRPEYVIPPSAECDDLLRRTLAKYLKREWKQGTLPFMRSIPHV